MRAGVIQITERKEYTCHLQGGVRGRCKDVQTREYRQREGNIIVSVSDYLYRFEGEGGRKPGGWVDVCCWAEMGISDISEALGQGKVPEAEKRKLGRNAEKKVRIEGSL